MGPAPEKLGLREVLARQMSSPGFPVRFDELPSTLETRELRSGDRVDLGDVRVTVAKLNHPGGVLAYRVEHAGASVVYATDTEHYACVDPALRALADRADVLIYDAQYTPEEYRGEAGPSKAGWGHSTFEEGGAAGAGRERGAAGAVPPRPEARRCGGSGPGRARAAALCRQRGGTRGHADRARRHGPGRLRPP